MTARSFNSPHVIESRNAMVREYLKQGAKYLGKVGVESVCEEGLKFMVQRRTGREVEIEYHMFELNELPIIAQFRIVENDNVRRFTVVKAKKK